MQFALQRSYILIYFHDAQHDGGVTSVHAHGSTTDNRYMDRIEAPLPTPHTD